MKPRIEPTLLATRLAVAIAIATTLSVTSPASPLPPQEEATTAGKVDEPLATWIQQLSGDRDVAIAAARRIAPLGKKGGAAIPALRDRLLDPTVDSFVRSECMFARLCVGGDLSDDLAALAELAAEWRAATAMAIVHYGTLSGGTFVGIEDHALDLCELVGAAISDPPAKSDGTPLVNSVVRLITSGLYDSCLPPLYRALEAAAARDDATYELTSGVLNRLRTHPITRGAIEAHPRQLSRRYLRQRAAAITAGSETPFVIGAWSEIRPLPWLDDPRPKRVLSFVDASTGLTLARCAVPGGGNPVVALSSADCLIATGGAPEIVPPGGPTSHIAHLFRRETGVVQELPFPANISRAEALSVGATEAISFAFRRVIAWDLSVDKPKPRVIADDYRGPGIGLTLAPTGDLFLIPDELRGIQLRASHDGSIVGRFSQHEAAVTSIAISDDSSTVVSTDRNGRTYVWDLRSQELLRELSPSPPGGMSVALSRDGTRCAVGLNCQIEDGTVVAPEMAGSVRLFDVRTGEELERYTTAPMPVLAVAFSHDDREIGATTLWHAYRWSTPEP